MSQQFKLLTYNIHKGFSPGRLQFQLPKMREALQSIDAEIVFLQEVLGEHRRESKRRDAWPELSQLEYIAHEIWPHAVYGKNVIYQVGHHGSAILSKYPIIAWENIDVSKSRLASRSLLHATFEIPHLKKPLHGICVHLGLFKGERADQMSQLQQLLHQAVDTDAPIIIAGDFNDWRKEATAHLAHLGFREVFQQTTGNYAKTFPALRPTWRADRIYYRGLSLQAGFQYADWAWRRLSDHLPLAAEFVG